MNNMGYSDPQLQRKKFTDRKRHDYRINHVCYMNFVWRTIILHIGSIVDSAPGKAHREMVCGYRLPGG